MNLKPCPSCGKSHATEFHASNYPGDYQVICNANKGGCGTATGFDTGKDGAAAKWNRRPEVKIRAWYVQGAGGFYLNEKEIPESARKLGLIPLGEVNV